MRKYIGSTIEAPALYPEYTAWQNLELQRVLLGNPDTTRGTYIKKAISRCISKRASHFMVVLLLFINEYSILCIGIRKK